MRPGFGWALGVALLAGPHPKPPAATGHPPPAPARAPHLAPPLPMLPSVGRVRVEVGRDRLVVVEEVTLPRGSWQSGGLDLFVAFGAPGTPLAVDVHLVPVPAGRPGARLEDAGDPVAIEAAVRHTASTRLLLGRPTMAGVAIHVKEAQLRQAYATSETASLRIRSLVAPGAPDASGAQGLVVRLGIDDANALAIGDLQIVSSDGQRVTRAEATLCGPEADPHPLTVSVLPRPAGSSEWPTTVSPLLVTRRPTDDLCLRWWSS